MKRKLRITQCISHFALGGAERIALTLLEQLQAEFEFSTFAVQGLKRDGVGEAMLKRHRELGVPTAEGPRIPMRFGGMLSGAFCLHRAIRKFRPDIIHLHSEIPESCYALLTALSRTHRQTPVLRTVHNSSIWWFSPSLGHWCDRRLSQARCVAVSQAAQSAMAQLRISSGGRPFREDPPIIPNGVPPSELMKTDWQPSDPIEIVYGGRLDQQKGVDLLEPILTQTRLPVGKRARLTLYGDGDLLPQIRGLAQRPPAGWEIHWHPPSSDFRRIVVEKDLMILPSRFEGMPLIAIEAQLAGLPLVTTRAPGMKEAVAPDHRWLARPGDAEDFAAKLTQALAESDRWSPVATAGVDFAKARFSVEKMARDYGETYHRMGQKP